MDIPQSRLTIIRRRPKSRASMENAPGPISPSANASNTAMRAWLGPAIPCQRVHDSSTKLTVQTQGVKAPATRHRQRIDTATYNQPETA